MKQVAIIILIFCSLNSKAQEHNLEESLDRLLGSWDEKQGPAITVAVLKDGKPLFNKSWGMANIQQGTPNDPSINFWVASVTKQFTAAAVYLLAREHKIEINRSIRHYLPDLPGIFNTVTIEQLIHHTSGIRDGFVLTALSKKTEVEYTNQNVFSYLKMQQGFNFPPGTSYEYNNAGYVLLAMLIETVAQTSFPRFMKENIFEPLQMHDSYISGKFPRVKSQAMGYHSKNQSNDKATFEEGYFLGDSYGSTGLITNINDLIKWSQLMQQPGRNKRFETIISKLLEPGQLNNGKKIGYAGGLEKQVYKGKTVYEHFGADEGFKANMIYFPQTKLTVIGLTNNSTYWGLSALLYEIADLLQHEKNSNYSPGNSADSVSVVHYYYDETNPQFILLKQDRQTVTLAKTLLGYAAPHRKLNNSLHSLDPLPTHYLLQPGKIIYFDPIEQKKKYLEEIVPENDTDDLAAFEGTYYSQELKTGYKIIVNDKKLTLEFAPGVGFDLFRLTHDDFMFDYAGANFLQFKSNGFYFSREGVRKLKFSKTLAAP